MTKCVCIVVTYRTTSEILKSTLRSITTQVQGLVVVDNSSGSDSTRIKDVVDEVTLDFSGDLELVQIGRNVGIAAAQNIGINVSEKMGADYVIFSDHDTQFPQGAVAALRDSFEELVSQGLPVACVGPAYLNTHDSDTAISFFTTHGCGLRRTRVDASAVEVSFLIASGIFTSMDALKAVGRFKEEYFIDWIDTEWCFRAISMGYRIYGCANVILRHRLGNDVKKFFGWNIVEHSSFRTFYKIRNAIYLSRSSVVSDLGVRIWLMRYAIVNSIIIPLTCSPRRGHIVASARGLWHGIIRKPEAATSMNF